MKPVCGATLTDDYRHVCGRENVAYRPSRFTIQGPVCGLVDDMDNTPYHFKIESAVNWTVCKLSWCGQRVSFNMQQLLYICRRGKHVCCMSYVLCTRTMSRRLGCRRDVVSSASCVCWSSTRACAIYISRGFQHNGESPAMFARLLAVYSATCWSPLSPHLNKTDTGLPYKHASKESERKNSLINSITTPPFPYPTGWRISAVELDWHAVLYV